MKKFSLLSIVFLVFANTVICADEMRFNRPIPFPGHIPFELDRQGFATAEVPFILPEAEADLSTGALVGLERMPRRQSRGSRSRVLDTEQPLFPGEPVRILLSKSKYPFEDRHLDAVVWTTAPEDVELSGELDVMLKDAEGEIIARSKISDLSPSGWFFSMGFPSSLSGESGSLEVAWMRDGVELARAEREFKVLSPANIVRSGRVPIRLLNKPGATIASMPFTVGVPFPRGVLEHSSHARLVDEAGEEIPLQTKVSARWSRYGDVKWLLCDFSADLEGLPREVYLEYGPDIRRSQRPVLGHDVDVDTKPILDAGCIRLTERGLECGPESRRSALFGCWSSRVTLTDKALRGAFVTRGDGRKFTIPDNHSWVWEELGGEKAVLRRTGWYEDSENGERFCNFITRLIVHRDSPVVRIFHTWIFTGDGNRDRIREMGWHFPAGRRIKPLGFLEDFESGRWLEGGHLVQFDYSQFKIDGENDSREGRIPGVMGMELGGQRVFLGVKDFWQNFPSELEFSSRGFTFYNWPRHNPPASHESPIPERSAYLVRFAHEGEMLDFRLPEEYTQNKYRANAASVECANAQGISRTEEMFLYFADKSVAPEQATRVMRGLNDETLRAVADPAWMAASGVFGLIHHRDPEKYPLDEHIYEQVCHAPARWNERLGFYGMWLHGESPSYEMDIRSRSASLYRALRRNHHGWPVKWIPYARSGDPAMLKYAEAATRQQIDVSLCHYLSEDVNESIGRSPAKARRLGSPHGPSSVPWTGGNPARGISEDVDYFWDHYYLTGFTRARDAVLLMGEATKLDWTTIRLRGRRSVSALQRYVHMYQATFDPWFLVAAHDIARMHQAAWMPDGPVDPFSGQSTVGHFWRAGDRDFYWFTGDDSHRKVALNVAASWSTPWNYFGGGRWPRLEVPYIEESATGWYITGDDYYLARAAGYLDFANMYVYDAESPEYYRGSNTRSGSGVALSAFTGWYIQQFPLALGAFEHAGRRPDPVPSPILQYQARTDETVDVDGETLYKMRFPEILVRKRTEEALRFRLATWQAYENVEYEWQAIGPDGLAAAGGVWNLRPSVAEIPAGTPVGVYRLTVGGLNPDPRSWPGTQGAPMAPMAPPNVPEVMTFERDRQGTSIGSARGEVQYWFLVPEGTRQFWIRTGSVRHAYRRLTIWDPDGGRAWDYIPPEEFGNEWVQLRADITVPSGQDGKLWRVSGNVRELVIDPQIPPYFSISRSKWFNPEER